MGKEGNSGHKEEELVIVLALFRKKKKQPLVYVYAERESVEGNGKDLTQER